MRKCVYGIKYSKTGVFAVKTVLICKLYTDMGVNVYYAIIIIDFYLFK